MNIIHFGNVKGGRLQLEPSARERLKEDLKRFEGKEIQMTIKRRFKSRSDRQNRYYWGVVLKILSTEIGDSPEAVHEALKFKFLGTTEVKGLELIKSSAGLSTEEMTDYIESIRTWAVTFLNCEIPEAGSIEF